MGVCPCGVVGPCFLDMATFPRYCVLKGRRFIYPPLFALMVWFVLVLLLGLAPWTVRLRYAVLRGRRLIYRQVCLADAVCPCACVGVCFLDWAAFPNCGVLGGGAPVYLSSSAGLVLWLVLVLVLGFAFWALQHCLDMVSWRGAGPFAHPVCIDVGVCPCACAGLCFLDSPAFPGLGFLLWPRFIYLPLLHWWCGLSCCLCWALPLGHCNIPWPWCLGGAPVPLPSPPHSALILWFVIVFVLGFAS